MLREPGLYVRIPGLHNLRRADKRLQVYEAEPRELYLADQLVIEVDYYLTYRSGRGRGPLHRHEFRDDVGDVFRVRVVERDEFHHHSLALRLHVHLLDEASDGGHGRREVHDDDVL